MHEALVLFFAISSGLTASGIVASSYRLATGGKNERFGRTAYYASMVVAGPTVLIEKAAKGWREKSYSWVAFFLAVLVAGYWSFALGLFVLNVALAL